MTQKHIFLPFLISFIFSISVFAENHVLRVGIHGNYPPYEFSSDNKIIGFNIDILQQLSDLFSLDIEYIKADKYSLFTMLDSGQIDFISFCFQSQRNKRHYNLSAPYNIVSFGIFTTYSSQIKVPEDILHVRISLENKDLNETLSSNTLLDGIATLRGNQLECIQDVIENNSDAAIISTLSGKYIVEKNRFNNIKIPPINFKSLQYSFAFAKNNDSLVSQFNEGLDILRETGTYSRIYQKWFGKIRPIQRQKAKKTATYPYYIFSIIIISILWIYLNKRKHYKHLKDMNEKEIMMRHHAEKSLHDYKSLINNTIDHLPHIVFMKNDENKFLVANDTLAKLLGTSREKIINQDIGQYATNNSKIQKLIDYKEINSTPNVNKVQFIDATSQLKTYEVIKKSIEHPISPNKLLLVIAIDISKKEKYEQMLNKEKALLSSLINSLPDLIFYKNTQLEYIGGNEAFIKFNRFASTDDFVGKTDFDIFEKSLANQYLEADKEIIKTKKTVQFLRWENIGNNEKLLYETMKVPILDKSGNFSGIVGISHDITKQAKIQEKIKQDKNTAEQNDKLKTIFLTNLSHEIRTPLNSIIGFSDLLADIDLTYDQREEFTELIRESGSSLLSLVDYIIDLSNIEAKNIVLNKSKFDINRMIINMQNEINNERHSIQRKNIDLKYIIPKNEELPFYINNDEFRIKQIIRNLIKDSLTNASQGEIKFGYRINENIITFFIKDNRPSIPSDLQNNILKQYDNQNMMEQFCGSGIAMTVTKKLVTLIGGKIDFITNETDGSEIFFSIPITSK